jgi:cell division septation protein DedD
MTRMTEPEEHEGEPLDIEERSIFSALWFRAVVVILVVGVVAAMAVPYVLDVVQGPARPPDAVSTAAPSPAEPPMAGTSAPTPVVTPEPAPTMAPRPATPSTPVPPAATTPRPATVAGTSTAGSKSTTVADPPRAVSKPSMPAASRPAKSVVTAASSKSATKRPVEATPAAAPAASTPPARSVAAAPAPATAAEPTTGEGGGAYSVQVGAFRDREAARRLAAQLRQQGYTVDESVRDEKAEARPTSAAPATDRYHVFVAGPSASELSARLQARGLATEAAPGGVVVTPVFPLREAVTLSRDLTADGFQVNVRRVAAADPAAPTPRPALDTGAPLHRVRVTGFVDRAAAQAAARELEARGYRPFLARGTR